MWKLLTFAAATAFLALGGPAMALGGGDPAVNGSVTATPPGARGPYEPHAAPHRWRRHDYWRARRGDSLPRYAQTMPNYYWPGPQDGVNFGRGRSDPGCLTCRRSARHREPAAEFRA